MHFIFENNGFCLNCDWLQYSVLTDSEEPEIICPDGYRLEIAQGNNIFENRALLFNGNGEKVLTLLWKPYSSVLNKRLMTVQVANKFLYTGMIRKNFELVRQIVACSFNSVGRFDICLDFEANEDFLEAVKHLNSGHYYVQHKTEGSSWWHEVNKDNFKHKQTHCLTWGSPNSEIKVKLYHKSREQGLIGGDTPEKPWIVEEWEEAHFDKKNVWRLEFSLAGAGQLRWEKQLITLEMIENESWLRRVFFSLYHKRFVCRINQGKRQGHKNNDTRIYLIKLPLDGENLTWYEAPNLKSESKPAIELLRSLMRQVDNSAVMASKMMFESYGKMICEVIENYGLENYFKAVFEKDYTDYLAELYDKSGSGVYNMSLKPSRFFD